MSGIHITCLCLTLVCSQDAQPKEQQKEKGVNHLSMEVQALRTLRSLKITPAQLSKLTELAASTKAKSRKRELVKANNAYVKTLTQLRDALVANDEDKIDNLSEKLNNIKNAPDLDDEFDITDKALEEAERFLTLLTPQQVVAYVDAYGDDFPDPVQLIVTGLESDRDLSGKDWETARGELADHVAWLVAGLGTEAANKLQPVVAEFLNRHHAKKTKAGELETEARKLVGTPGPVVLLYNVLEYDLAELLSNPELKSAAKGIRESK